MNWGENLSSPLIRPGQSRCDPFYLETWRGNRRCELHLTAGHHSWCWSLPRVWHNLCRHHRLCFLREDVSRKATFGGLLNSVLSDHQSIAASRLWIDTLLRVAWARTYQRFGPPNLRRHINITLYELFSNLFALAILNDVDKAREVIFVVCAFLPFLLLIITVSCREVLRYNGFMGQKITYSSFQQLGDPQRQRCFQDTFPKQPLKCLHVRRRQGE